MEKKCNKYESLFVFRSDEELKQHLKGCADCRLEHEKMLGVSAIVREVKPLLQNRRNAKVITLRMAAAFLFIFISFFALNQNFNRDETKISYNVEALSLKQQSHITQMGLPTDDYGLISIE